MLDVVLEFLDRRITKESLLEALCAHEGVWWSGRIRPGIELEASSRHSPLDVSASRSRLLSSLGLAHEVQGDDTLSDHLCLHQDVFVVAGVVVLNLVSDHIEILVSRIPLVGPLEFVDPLDVLGLQLVPVDLESLECLNINWSLKIEVLVLLGRNQLLVLLIFSFFFLLHVKDLFEFL